jgi:predicted GIY-YIG superfamily endonuclease
MDFSYVYILQSEVACRRFYIGLTDDLKDRLRRHNAKEVPHTAKFSPWRIKTAVAFTDPGMRRLRALSENILTSRLRQEAIVMVFAYQPSNGVLLERNSCRRWKGIIVVDQKCL